MNQPTEQRRTVPQQPANEKSIEWNDGQREAIESRSSALLVSAAAGSGKTAVLTERILRQITNPDTPGDINRMLVVTFTRTAACQLKEKITKKLREAIKKDPDNVHLRRQYLSVPTAPISTIHSFYLNLMAEFYQQVDFPPDLRLCDESESFRLKRMTADRMITDYYEQDDGHFARFVSRYVGVEDREFVDLLLTLDEKCAEIPEGIEILRENADRLAHYDMASFHSTPYGEVISEAVSRFSDYAVEKYRQILQSVAGLSDLPPTYEAVFSKEADYYEELLSLAKQGSYTALSAWLNSFPKTKLSPPRGYEPPMPISAFLPIRKNLREKQKNLLKYFTQSTDDIARSAKETSDDALSFYRLLTEYERRLAIEKKNRSVCDFTDIERASYHLLVDDEGRPSALCRTLSKRYDEVYIDEYQDVNQIQDRIFACLTKESHRFMVGDIKQSIYGFRGSDPSIFAAYRGMPTVKTVFLRENYRSSGTVIEFANRICGNLFTTVGKLVPYDKANDDLIQGRTADARIPVRVCHLIADGITKKSDRKAIEMAFIANEIKALQKDGIPLSDICILTRNNDRQLIGYLEKQHIPQQSAEGCDLLKEPEVRLMLSLLRVIDNPTRDVDLCAVLKSPLFDFSMEELITVRKTEKQKKNESLYDTLRHSAKNEDVSFKSRSAIERLTRYRMLMNEPTDRILYTLLYDLNFGVKLSRGIDDEHAANCKRHLLALCGFAEEFEHSGFRGLSAFLSLIDTMIAGKKVLQASSTEAKDNAVTVMTIHKSKGLEFPVVILAETGFGFSGQVASEVVHLDKRTGFTKKCKDAAGRLTKPNFFHKAGSRSCLDAEFEEEMRLLYVALTRCRDRLIIVGTTDQANDAYYYDESRTGADSRFLLSESPSYLKWILYVLRPDEVERIPVGKGFANQNGNTDTQPAIDTAASSNDTYDMQNQEAWANDPAIATLSEKYRERIRFTYRDSRQILPAKLSVSTLTPVLLDDAAEDDASSVRYPQVIGTPRIRTARFLGDQVPTGAERGTATHSFMQFCDFHRLAATSVDEEIEILIRDRYIDESYRALINRSAIRTFLQTPLFSDIMAADFLRRELRFNVHLPARLFTTDEGLRSALKNDTLLVQGIIDLIFRDKAGNTLLVDYKTDALSPSERATDEIADRTLIERHKRQLSYYYAAARLALHLNPDHVLIYAFSLGRSIDIPLHELLTPNDE